MEEKTFTLVFEGKTLVSPDKYFVDKYGNRYMIFSDGGNKTKIRRDDLIIDMATGKCTLRNPGQINTFKI